MKYSLQGTCDDLHDTRKTLITKDLDGWMYGFVNLLMDCGNEKALPDAVAETKLKQLFFDEFESEAKRHEWQLKWRPESSCVIHVRLDDMRLHSNFDNQKFIGEEALSSLILNTHNRFPSHDIQIVTSPKKEDQILCEDIVKRSGVKCNVIGNDNVDYDLWLMMHCDILIMSRSTFSFIAGLLHQGSEVYTYEKWSHFDEIVGSYHPKYKGKNISKVFKVL